MAKKYNLKVISMVPANSMNYLMVEIKILNEKVM